MHALPHCGHDRVFLLPCTSLEKHTSWNTCLHGVSTVDGNFLLEMKSHPWEHFISVACAHCTGRRRLVQSSTEGSSTSIKLMLFKDIICVRSFSEYCQHKESSVHAYLNEIAKHRNQLTLGFIEKRTTISLNLVHAQMAMVKLTFSETWYIKINTK